MSALTKRFGAGATVGFAAVAVSVMVFGITSLRADATAQRAGPAPLPVPVISVEQAGDAVTAEFFPGIIAARRNSALGFERGGRIDDIAVDVGDRVEVGDLLARLDTRALEAQIAAADAQTAEAGAQVALARETEDRQGRLLEQGHISQQRFDELSTSTMAAAARRDAADAAADALRVQLDLSVITAPFSGVITARHMDEGAVASPGLPILDIIENTALEIRVGLPLNVADTLVPGRIYTFDAEGSRVEARLRASTGVVDRQTRTVAAVFDLVDPASVAPGEVARLAIETEISSDGFWVPTTALAEGRRGLWTVYALVEQDGAHVLEPRVVETIRIEAERVYVRGAVAHGELLLASGLQRVTPGQRVQPAQQTAGLSTEG